MIASTFLYAIYEPGAWDGFGEAVLAFIILFVTFGSITLIITILVGQAIGKRLAKHQLWMPKPQGRYGIYLFGILFAFVELFAWTVFDLTGIFGEAWLVLVVLLLLHVAATAAVARHVYLASWLVDSKRPD